MYPLPDRAPTIRHDEHAARRPVAELYDSFVPPEYDGAGVFVLSLVPYGQLAEYVFLKDDPEHVYAVLSGPAGTSSKDSVTLARLAQVV